MTVHWLIMSTSVSVALHSHQIIIYLLVVPGNGRQCRQDMKSLKKGTFTAAYACIQSDITVACCIQ